MTSARSQELVAPFYLEVMRLNALDAGPDIIAQLVAVGRTVTSDEVVALLRDAWRERVMGAWYALLLADADEVLPALTRALETSHGSLDAPPLTVAAVILGGEDSLSALAGYARRDRDGQWGAAGFAAAAMEHLGAPVGDAAPSDADRADLAALLAIGRSLASGAG